MLTALLSLSLALAAADVEAGATLSYQGHLSPADDQVGAPKQIALTCVVAETAPGAAEVWWTLQEQGRGGWSWIDRFGRWRLSGAGDASGGLQPSSLFESEEATGVVEIAPLLAWPGQDLKAGATWKEERTEHRVVGAERRGDRATWVVEVHSPYGKQRTYWLDQGGPTVVALEAQVTLGQGKRHELRLELKESKQLARAQLDSTVEAFKTWEQMRASLGWQGRSRRASLRKEKLDTFREAIPEAANLAQGTALEALATDAQKDLQAQASREGAEAAMRNRLVGRPAPALKLQGAAGEKLSTQDLSGKVTVLHFWEYRDEPLRDPYGQVGFLDFLARGRSAEKVQVVGVAVDVPAAASERQAAGRSVRRMKSFMNLSYPVLLDDGSALKEFGDPRASGGELPLFVVIDAKGNVAHRHAGLYETQRDRGLDELDRAVTDAERK